MYMSSMMTELLDYMKISVEEAYNEDEYDLIYKSIEQPNYFSDDESDDNTQLC